MAGEWKRVRVSEVCELIVDCVNKTAPVVDGSTPYKMLRTTNIKGGRINREECRRVSKDTFAKWTRRADVRYGDVILTREAPLGEVGYVDFTDTVFLGQRLMQYRAKAALLEPRFLLYSFLSADLQNQFGAHEGSGSTVSHIRVGDCSKFELNLPPLPEQKAIAQILGSLDDKIELNRRMNATLEAMARALFQSWFVDFEPVRAKLDGRQPFGIDKATAVFPDSFQDSEMGHIPKGWKVQSLAESTAYLNRGIGPSYTETGGILVLNQKCIRDHRINLEPARRHDVELKSIDGRQIKELDVLVNSTGTGTLGRVAQVLHLPEPAIVDSHVTVVRASPDVSPYFLGIILLGREAEIEQLAEGSTGQTELSRSRLGGLKFVIPSAPLQKHFDSIVGPMLAQIANNDLQSRALATLRDALLPRLLSGQMRIQAPTQP